MRFKLRSYQSPLALLVTVLVAAAPACTADKRKLSPAVPPETSELPKDGPDEPDPDGKENPNGTQTKPPPEDQGSGGNKPEPDGGNNGRSPASPLKLHVEKVETGEIEDEIHLLTREWLLSYPRFYRRTSTGYEKYFSMKLVYRATAPSPLNECNYLSLSNHGNVVIFPLGISDYDFVMFCFSTKTSKPIYASINIKKAKEDGIAEAVTPIDVDIPILKETSNTRKSALMALGTNTRTRNRYIGLSPKGPLFVSEHVEFKAPDYAPKGRYVFWLGEFVRPNEGRIVLRPKEVIDTRIVEDITKPRLSKSGLYYFDDRTGLLVTKNLSWSAESGTKRCPQGAEHPVSWYFSVTRDGKSVFPNIPQIPYNVEKYGEKPGNLMHYQIDHCFVSLDEAKYPTVNDSNDHQGVRQVLFEKDLYSAKVFDEKRETTKLIIHDASDHSPALTLDLKRNQRVKYFGDTVVVYDRYGVNENGEVETWQADLSAGKVFEVSYQKDDDASQILRSLEIFSCGTGSSYIVRDRHVWLVDVNDGEFDYGTRCASVSISDAD